MAENGKAVRRNVKTGLFDADRIVISEGLNAGDRVITSWTSELKEGVKVKENQVKSPVSLDDAAGNDTAPVEDMSGDAAADTDKGNEASEAGKDEDKNSGRGDNREPLGPTAISCSCLREKCLLVYH